jgi:hypothetical protein
MFTKSSGPAVGPTQLHTQSVHAGCGAHPASYSIDTWHTFPGGKAAEREAHHSRPSTAEVELYIHSLLCLRGMHRDSSALLTQTPQERRDSTLYMAFSLSHSWQSYVLILHCVTSNAECPFCPVHEHAALTGDLSHKKPASTGNVELFSPHSLA